jgi:hypothetical protein
MLHDLRLAAQFRLTDAARALRIAHPGYSLADCFELAALHSPGDARLVAASTDDREARGMGHDPTSAEAIRDGAADRKQAIRLYARGANGRVDRNKVIALMEANSIWEDRYAGISPQSLLSTAIFRIEQCATRGHEVVLP